MRYYVQTQSHGEVVFPRLEMKLIGVKRLLTLSQLRFVLGGRLFLAEAPVLERSPKEALSSATNNNYTVVQLVLRPNLEKPDQS